MDVFDRKTAGKQFSRVGWGVFTFVAVSSVTQIALILLLMFVTRRTDWIRDSESLLAINEICMGAFAFPACVAVIKNRPAPALPMGPKLSVGEFISFFCMAMTVTYAFNFVGGILMEMLGGLLHKTVQNPLDALLDGSSLWIQLISLLIIAPLLEEYIFRKCVVTSLAPYSHKAAIFLSGFSFGLIHGNFYQFFYAFFLGILFAYIFLRTGRLRYSILLHFLINLFGGAIPLILEIYFPAASDLDVIGNLNETLPYMAYLFFLLVTVVAGFILLIVKRKSFLLSPDRPCIPRDTAFSVIFGNSGIIVMTLCGLLLLVVSVFVI